MSQRRRRRGGRSDETAPTTRSSIAKLSFPEQDTLRLRTFWSPLPNWTYGAIPGIIGAVLAALLIGGSDMIGALLLGAAAGYFGGGILWAILGVVGGDVLEIDFDLSADVGRVHQSMLWTIKRDWTFELYDIETVLITRQRSRPILLQFSGSYSNYLTFADGTRLRVGRFPTERESLDIADAVSNFIGVQLERPD